MLNIRQLLIASLFVLLALSAQFCTADKLPPPTVSDDCDTLGATYEEQVQDIINSSCAYAGCHVADFPGNFTTYDDILATGVTGGEFRRRVVLEREDPNVGMPPDYAPPGRPKDLTPEQLEIMECWISGGYPRN